MWCQFQAPVANSVVIGSHNGGSELVIGLVKAYIQKSTNSTYEDIFSIDIKFNDFYDLAISRLKKRVIADIIEWEMNSNDFAIRYKNYTDDPIGLVFIDGFHSFKQCLSDFLQIKDFLMSGSIVCFHDASPIFPKIGLHIQIDLNKLNNIEEDFEIDAAISWILQEFPEFIELEIPLGQNCDRRRETGRQNWEKCKTSSYNSLFGIVLS
jgi:hypothetical protein